MPTKLPRKALDEFCQFYFGTDDFAKIQEKFGWRLDVAEGAEQIGWIGSNAFDGRLLVEMIKRMNEFFRAKRYGYYIRLQPGELQAIRGDENLFVQHKVQVVRKRYAKSSQS